MNDQGDELDRAVALTELYLSAINAIDGVIGQLPHPSDFDYPIQTSGEAAIELDAQQQKLLEVRLWLVARWSSCNGFAKSLRRSIKARQSAASRKAAKASK